LKFAKGESGLRRSSPEEYLRDEARLKATFPGYPRESTPRVECYSTEEFLLKEGRLFSVESLTSEETSLLREAHEALKRAAGGAIPAGESWSEDGWATVADGEGKLVHVRLPSREHVDPWTNFAVAQLGWEATDGRLSYVEGVVLKTGGAGPIPSAWNLVNDKVVLVRKDSTGGPGAEYFGAVLDEELRDAASNPFYRRHRRILPFTEEVLDD
jgi:hypothetical protein